MFDACSFTSSLATSVRMPSIADVRVRAVSTLSVSHDLCEWKEDVDMLFLNYLKGTILDVSNKYDTGLWPISHNFLFGVIGKDSRLIRLKMLKENYLLINIT